jgi:hypothetical protein
MAGRSRMILFAPFPSLGALIVPFGAHLAGLSTG